MSDRAPDWRSPPRRLTLKGGEIHLWRGSFRCDPVQEGIFESYLSTEELLRAAGYVERSHRDRFVFAHGMLRAILGCYASCEPRLIAYKNNAYGKPALAGPSGSEEIHFNMAHSKDVVLVALCRFNEVGVDVEYERPLIDLDQIISRNFTAADRLFLDSLPADQLQRAFFVHWTLKEAIVKGIGLGLSCPLDSFGIIPAFCRNAIGALYTAVSHQGLRWKCLSLSPGAGYVGALAAESIASRPICWNYQPGFID